MFTLIKKFVFLGFLFISGVLIGGIYTPEIIVQSRSMNEQDKDSPPVIKKNIRTKPAKKVRIV